MASSFGRTQHTVQRSMRSSRDILALVRAGAEIAARAPSAAVGLQQTISFFCSWSGWPVGHVYLRMDDDQPLLAPAPLWYGAARERFGNLHAMTEAIDFRPGYGRIGAVLASGTPQWSVDITTDREFVRAHKGATLEARAFFAFPVIDAGEVAAVCEFFHTDPAPCDPDFLEAGAIIGLQLGQVFTRERQARTLARMAWGAATQSKEAFNSQAIRTVGDLADAVSHEINNPLFALRTMAALLGAELPPDSSAAAYIAAMNADLERIAQTMSQVHALTQRPDTV